MDMRKLLQMMLLGLLFLTAAHGSPLSVALGLSHINSPKTFPYKLLGCAHKCPEVLRPVCAVDAAGITKDFKNSCFLHHSYCSERKVYAYLKDGYC